MAWLERMGSVPLQSGQSLAGFPSGLGRADGSRCPQIPDRCHCLPRSCNESCQLKLGDIDVELDCGMCIRKGNKSSSGALLPESGSDDK